MNEREWSRVMVHREGNSKFSPRRHGGTEVENQFHRVFTRIHGQPEQVSADQEKCLRIIVNEHEINPMAEGSQSQKLQAG